MAVDHFAQDREYYSNIEELIAETDIVETDVYIAGWNKKFRIRGLNFGQQEDINTKSTNKDTGELDHKEWVLWTLVHGVVRPMMNYTQAKMLIDKNGTFLNSLADEIWNIGRISRKVFDDYIDAVTKIQADNEKQS
jgi:hypothetical protein